MKTKASIKALTDPINEETRWTHRKIAYNGYKDCELTIRELSTKVVMPYNAMEKRISELYEEDILIIVGEKLENGQPNSIYKHNPEPPNPEGKKPTFAQYAKTREDWKHQYRALIHHEI